MDSALVALLNQASAFLNEGASPRRMGNRHPSIAPYETYGTWRSRAATTRCSPACAA